MKVKSKKSKEDRREPHVNKTQIDDVKIDIDNNVFRREEDRTQMENDTNDLILAGKKKSKQEQPETTLAKEPKKKLSKKEKKRLEKVLERKNKSLKRDDLLKKLAMVQVNSNELRMYGSVKDIGKKEKRKLPLDASAVNATQPSDQQTHQHINSISGSNRKRKTADDESENDDNKSIDTDDVSTDDEIDDERINKALEQFKKKQTDTNDVEKKVEAPIKSESNQNENGQENKTQARRATKYVHVERREEIKEIRSKLPIITEEQIIMETIYENDIVIICGETGSGKTTQVPQFLYEAGYAEDGYMIGVTEPRRVAAISMSNRVNDEMNFNPTDAIVSYQIRYEGTSSPNTKIKFMTDGVLLKEVQTDFLLNKYSAIIIDEAHERSVFTDILIGLLSRIVPLRNKKGNPLKLIIMSATLRVEDFTENKRLFKQTPPIIKVDSRQYSVAVHFNRHTCEDYLAEAYRKVCKIHRKLPEGGILVFLTGQQEVNVLCSKLRKTFPTRINQRNETTGTETVDFKKEPVVAEKTEKKKKKKSRIETDKNPTLDQVPAVNLDNYLTKPLDEELENIDHEDDEEVIDEQFNLDNDDGLISGSDDEEENADGVENPLKTGQSAASGDKPLHVLPLYALLSSEKQTKVFEKVPDNCRLCVVATNIAETSLTIPNIKYVVDSGKIKVKFYDKITGVSTFKICWTSKASAEQRAGRAGRTSPGHCYRLYSSAVYNDEFVRFAEPEIVRKPVEDLVLQMKDLGIDRIANFPFPTSPDAEALKVAEDLLIKLGALEVEKKGQQNELVSKITNLGKTMACFPINPRYAKMLALASHQPARNEILSYVICLISGLSVQELFLEGETSTVDDKQTQVKVKYSQMRQSLLDNMPESHTKLLGDLMLVLVILGAFEYELNKPGGANLSSSKFCELYGVRYKAANEARKLRKQLVNTVNLIFADVNLVIDPNMMPPSQEQAKLLRQIVLSGMVDRVAKKYEHVVTGKDGKQLKNAYQGLILEEPIFIHPSSVLFKQLPEYVCFVELVETSKTYMKGLCAIEDTWLPVYLGNQCSFEKPIITETDGTDNLKPRFDPLKGTVVCHRDSKFGKLMWSVKPVEVDFPECVDLYKWFARFILEGAVIEELKKYQNVLLSSPSTMLKSWAKLQPRTESLLNALINEKCNNKQKLLNIWKTKPEYLLVEYLAWLPESLHFELRLKWPPVVK